MTGLVGPLLRLAFGGGLQAVRRRAAGALVDLEDDLARLLRVLVALLAFAALASLALLALAAALVVVFWETYRIGALLLVFVAFGVAAAIAALVLSRLLRERSRVIASTLRELSG